MIKMIVFDMAGTTVNEDNLVYKTIQKAIFETGISVTLEEVLSIAAGKEKLQAIKSVLEIKNIKDNVLAEKIFNHFNEMLNEAYEIHDIVGQPKVLEVFHSLKEKGIFVILNTGYSRKIAELLIDKLEWKQGVDFDLLVTASDVVKSRPNPDMIYFAMKAFSIKKAIDVIKVGDSAIDIDEGKNAGCKYSIGITTGAQTQEQLQRSSPSFIINNLCELLPLIEKDQS